MVVVATVYLYHRALETWGIGQEATNCAASRAVSQSAPPEINGCAIHAPITPSCRAVLS